MSAPLLLLVDDAPEINFLVGRLSRQSGHTLIACRDALGALEWLATMQPDLAIVDVNLPGMSGLELCTHIRHSPGLERLPIALFAHGRRTEDILAGLEAGADFLLSKDLLPQPDAWRARLDEILNACRGRAKTDLVEYSDSPLSLSLPDDGIPALNEALRHPAVLQLGTPVVQFLLRRAVQRLAQIMPATDGQPGEAAPDDIEAWLLPDGLGLTSAAFPVWDRAQWVSACAGALAEQIGTLWGNAAGHAARTALLAVNSLPPVQSQAPDAKN
jgi:CheY-like chemotaxis protein